MQPVLLRGRDTGLVLTVELDGLSGIRKGACREGTASPQRNPAPKAPTSARAFRRLIFWPRNGVSSFVLPTTNLPYELVKTWPTLERGSARASIFWLSSRRCSSSTLS